MRFWINTIRATVAALVLMHVVPTDASAERRGRVFLRRPSNVNRGGLLVNRNGQRIVDGINVDNLQETGFSRLKANGNQLVEVNRNGQVNRIFFDNFGRVFGATDPQTIPQLKEFFLSNVDKLRGNQQNAVKRFLARNGAGSAILGGIAVDLSNIVQLDDGQFPYAPKGDQKAMALAALNYALNSISQSAALMKVGAQNMRSDGLVGLNLNGFLRGEALAALVNNNPYSCGTGRVRLDWLITRAMDPQLYYQTIGAPQTYQQLSAQLGTEPNRRFTAGNKILIAPPEGKKGESLVGRHPERILEVQNTRNIPGGSLYMTYDNPYNLTGEKAKSSSVLQNGIDTNIVAGEAIFTKPNGFMGFWLSTADGKRQNSAPVEIAENVKHYANSNSDVSTPVACMRCHNNGFIGGGIALKTDENGKNQRYTDNFNKLTASGLNNQGHFTTNAVYNDRRARDSRVFRNALIRSGAFWPDSSSNDKNTGEVGAADLLGAYTDQMRAPLTMTAAARELGTTPEIAAAVLRTNANGTVSRESFETSYCALRQQVASRQVPGGAPQTPIDQRRLASQPGAAPGGFVATSAVAHSNDTASKGGGSRPVAQ